MPTLFQIKSYITYWLNAVTEHSLHSPFLYNFYINILKPKKTLGSPNVFETLRKALENDSRTISFLELGSGSTHFNGQARKVSSLALTSLSPVQFSTLYSRIIHYYNLQNIVELGTSLGINTLYLSMKENTKVSTFEGSPEIAKIARSIFESAKVINIDLHEGNIETTLPAFLKASPLLDFIFIDANHRYEPTLRYFQWLAKRVHTKTIMIIDDIHYSQEMEKAWNEIRKSSVVYGSIDIFRCGILFFDPSLNKQHAVIQY